jgi:asparagine synthase (glutamine-hydrolysing)
VDAVTRDCALLARGEGEKLGEFGSLGLGGVIVTQLWHHLYLGGGLCALPHLTYAPEAAVTAAPTSRGERTPTQVRGKRRPTLPASAT